MIDIDRPTGILTRKDRRYLIHDTLPESRQTRYERRKGARERIKNGLLDLPAIRFLPPEERQKVFGDMEPGSDLYWAFVSGVALTKHACDAAGVPFQELLQDGIELGLTEPRGDRVEPEVPEWSETGRGKILESVDIEITPHYRDAYYPPKLKERWLAGERLTPAEMGTLVRSDEFDEGAFRELQERRERNTRTE